MTDLTAVFAGNFAGGAGGLRNQVAGARPSDLELAETSKPVLQLNSFPSPIDLEKYRCPHSGDNPEGDYPAAYRFRNLCNQIPTFTRCFNASGNYVEKVWKNIIHAEGTTDYARHLLAEAQRQFQSQTLSGMGGVPDDWLLVDAGPSNWFDLVKNAPKLVLDFTKPSLASNYLLLEGWDPLVWRGLDSANKNQDTPLRGKTEIIELRALKVDLVRNWLDFHILAIGGWHLPGVNSGFYSSGDPAENRGLFPLLPTAVIVGVDVTVRGEWTAEDKNIVDTHLRLRTPLSLGPFPLVSKGAQAIGIDGTGAIRSEIAHVVGYISNVVPYAPRDTNLKPGSVLVRNDGAFVARFSVQWRDGGVKQNSESGNFPALSAKSVDVPSGAQDVEIKMEIMTFPPPFETWKTVATYPLTSPVRQSFQLTGTTMDPKIATIEPTK